MASPIAQQDPNIQLAALKKALRALKATDLASQLPNNIPAPPPPSPMNQVDENAGFMNEKDHPVLPDDDHVDHLTRMDEVEKSPLFATYSPTAKQIHKRHRQGHQAEAYKQGMTLKDRIAEMDDQHEREQLNGTPGMA